MDSADVERLTRLPLFGELDAHDLGHVAGWLRDVELAPGEVLITQGAMPDDVYVLEDGTVEVVRDGEHLAELGAGDVVGEIALVDPQRRTATVRATTPVRAVALNLRDLPEMASEMPEIIRRLRSIAQRRLEEQAQR
ncbi:MAG TPA: cyclic nucleotide-binding domain-containing protein [Actinomycetota bacterium]|nr:cyclic nucleotide-binding domain-containing protein [Actinomycetota bacterium]